MPQRSRCRRASRTDAITSGPSMRTSSRTAMPMPSSLRNLLMTRTSLPPRSGWVQLQIVLGDGVRPRSCHAQLRRRALGIPPPAARRRGGGGLSFPSPMRAAELTRLRLLSIAVPGQLVTVRCRVPAATHRNCRRPRKPLTTARNARRAMRKANSDESTKHVAVKTADFRSALSIRSPPMVAIQLVALLSNSGLDHFAGGRSPSPHGWNRGDDGMLAAWRR